MLPPLYRALGLTWLVAIGWIVGAGVLGILILVALSAFERGGAFATGWLYGFGVFIGVSWIVTVYASLALNAAVAALTLEGGHRFAMRLSPWRMMWIGISNLAAILASVGLLYAWAAIRLYRYQCECLTVIPGDDLDGFVDRARPAGSAIGSEYADFEGVDVVG